MAFPAFLVTLMLFVLCSIWPWYQVLLFGLVFVVVWLCMEWYEYR